MKYKEKNEGRVYASSFINPVTGAEQVSILTPREYRALTHKTWWEKVNDKYFKNDN